MRFFLEVTSNLCSLGLGYHQVTESSESYAEAIVMALVLL